MLTTLTARAQFAVSPLTISPNHRYFRTDGKPFFWLGDTGWLLFSKLDRASAEQYLETRSKQGFNVIQAMVIHDIAEVNCYGDSALIDQKIAHPKITPGNDFNKNKEYDYWDHIDWIISKAQEKGLYVALVPIWGGVVKGKRITPEQGRNYADFLAKRFGSRPNIIWMNGGDIAGNIYENTWRAIGSALHEADPNHLITFHPRGRTQSSTWFQDADWLSFNCFQSGHRTYSQDVSKEDLKYGEDNWRYVKADYEKTPVKPTLDAEPSYENIPYGLHDTKLPKWTDADVRRYGYWSVFAGACGYTYGNNDVMQMHLPGDKKPAYGSKEYWYTSINSPGAQQMIFLKKLILSRPYEERVPDQSMIAGQQGLQYDHLLATRGKKFAFIYTYNGREMLINGDKLLGQKLRAAWFNPRTGETINIGVFSKQTSMHFKPPGEKRNGNDWVLVLDSI
ncbi:glycoside hydrolase family 140 protein [Mucilaginibacter gracilis]|nr:glycoside hydrolase family 140 protein [Mucilaginibacter gracilis]